MNDPASVRQERVKRLLVELEYEVTRGMMDGELNEEFSFRFFIPISRRLPNGVVCCEFRTRPVTRFAMGPDDIEPRLRIVK